MDIKVTILIPVYNEQELILRAINSIPVRDDIEVIVIDDGSTDNTWNKLLNYKENTKLINFVLLYNETNKGVSYTINKGLDNANGEYIVYLGSDDYFYTDTFEKAMKELNGEDFIFFQTSNNYGRVELNEHNKCGSFKFMRREFMKDYRNDEFRKAGEDYHLWQKMIQAKPKIKTLGLLVKHYNYPKEGSLNWKLNNGIIDLESGEEKCK